MLTLTRSALTFLMKVAISTLIWVEPGPGPGSQ